MHQDTEQFSFHFSDISLPLRIAAVAILSVLAIVGIGSTARYAATLPKSQTNTQNNTSTNTNTNQTNLPTNNQSNPNITQPQVNPGNSSGTALRCNTTQRNSFTAQYNAQVAAENTRHQNVINFLNSSGASAAAIAAENATHAANLSSINAQYQNNLRSINC